MSYMDFEHENWLLAHKDPLAALNTLSSCVGLGDLHGDKEYKLVIADFGMNSCNMKLKVFKGTSIMSENSLIDFPAGLSIFHMDTTQPRVPAVAVASGSYIYIYKNLRPYFKFTLPTVQVNAAEFDAWNQARDDALDVTMLHEILDLLRQEIGESEITTRSQHFLMLRELSERQKFLDEHKTFILKRNTTVTCMETLKKNYEQDDQAISCLVLGTENSTIYILDPEAFVILTYINIPSVPVFLTVAGLYDVEYRVTVACRNGYVYSLKRGIKTAKPIVQLASHPVGLITRGKNIIVATMDKNILCFSNKGKKLWSIELPENIICIEPMEIESMAKNLIAVAAGNKVFIYYDKNLVDELGSEMLVEAMRFGSYGREKNALVLIFRGGGLRIYLMKRTAKFEPNTKEQLTNLKTQKLNVPKKTKLFVEQTIRERENAAMMHRTFQHGLFHLRLNTARAYVEALKTSNNPVSMAQDETLRLSAQVQGLGPTFKLKIELENTSSDLPTLDLSVVLFCDDKLYDIPNSYIKIPMLLPSIPYTTETFVKSVSEMGISDVVRVLVVRKNETKPVLSAIINMPTTEPYQET